jgi:hypothetical protein
MHLGESRTSELIVAIFTELCATTFLRIPDSGPPDHTMNL